MPEMLLCARIYQDKVQVMATVGGRRPERLRSARRDEGAPPVCARMGILPSVCAAEARPREASRRSLVWC